ncbi:hypothetical protein [Klebsiella quasipneumoniae]|uniref:hypothetical protein n=1 Tax=Klebsiella quasipneumoniae TaxID=1463165 RepID=UPI0021C12A9D|nr:hypothetical protein [Klebsiella quasipneumoniae]MCT8888055.1 hypothetical protein [Klebsiella quasipneumoniae subsp. similipneumoniae]
MKNDGLTLNQLAERNAVLVTEVEKLRAERDQLAAENAYLLNGAARELNTSWMFHKTMLGAQAALVCLAHGYQAAAREWLEGTTDEAGAEIPDDISVGELPEWFDSQMVSNDGKSGFLTRAEAEEAIRKACPATDAYLAGIKADSRAEGINFAASRLAAAFNHGFVDKPMAEVGDVVRMILTAKEDLANDPVLAADGLSGEYAEKSLAEWEAELREGADK